jgi:signal transduction histidine kinase
VRPTLYRAGKMNTGTAGWLAWTICGLSLSLTALGLLLLALNVSHPNVHIYDHWVEYTVTAISGSTLGVVIASRRPENPIGWIFGTGGGLAAGIQHFSAEYATYALVAEPGLLPGGEAAAWLTSWIWTLAIGLFVFVCLLFPNGQLPGSRWRFLAWLSVAVVLLGAASIAFQPGPIDGLGPIQNPLGFEGINVFEGVGNDFLVQALLGILGLVATTSLFVRLRHAHGEERQQLKWFAYAATLLSTGIVFAYTVSIVIGIRWFFWAGFVLVLVGVVGIPIAVAIAILKYRLYDIDLIINRTLVYGTLSATVIGLYVLVVGGLGVLFQAQGNFTISLLATGLVAILFQPLRSRLQRGVNHLMYGERDEPYAVISRLSRCLEATLAPDTALATVVETVAQALKLSYAAIALKQEDGFTTAAEHGTPPPTTGELISLPLAYRTEPVGRLILAPRAPGETFTPSDQRLLEDLARQAGAAVHAVRLTVDLQRSRERLVTAREEERRRLRRDLHDGLGPTLAGFTFELEAARNLLIHESQDARALLGELKGRTREAIAEIRRLVYDLCPPALDELGLVSAIREQATNHGHRDGREGEGGHEGSSGFSVEASEQLPPLPAAVEVACYRIAQEALTNVARHARAHTCRVRLSIDEAAHQLELEITDDGVGLPASRRAGVGLTSMRERAAELGGICAIEPVPTGGTRVLARLPLPPSEEHPRAASWAAPVFS